jgi:Zn-dependent protease with chaperone function
MSASPETQLNLIALAALNAIPVATFAIWLDYFERRVAEERVSRDYELAPDLQLLNASGVTTALAITIVFFATRPYRADFPILSVLLFLAALFGQTWLQARVARRISPVGVHHLGSETPLGKELQSSLWLAGMITAYLSLTGVLALSLATLFHFLGAEKVWVALAGGLGALGGVLTGLTFVYALAPLTLRKLFPVRPLPNSPLRSLIESAFARSKLPLPDLYVIRSEDLSMHNLMVAGFPRGRGPFKPAVFVFEALVNQTNAAQPIFTEAELQAMISHEVSHAALNHLKKRLKLTCLILPISVLLGGAAWAYAQHALPAGLAEFAQLFITVAVILAPFQSVNRLIKKQEIEADLSAVIDLGAAPQAMISALEKLDQLNGRKSEVAHGAHPSTAERIRELQGLIASNVVPFPSTQTPSSQSENQDAENDRGDKAA